MIHHHMKVDGNGLVFIVGNKHTLAHCLPAKQMHQSIGNRSDRHALYAEAVGRSHTCNIRKYITADGNNTFVCLKTHHKD